LRSIIDLSENSAKLGVCFDTCHVFAAGYDISHPRGVHAAVREFDSAVGIARLGLIHLNDSKKGAGSRADSHEGIGEGMIGTAGFAALLNHPKLGKVPVVLETPKFNNDEADIKNLDTVKKLIRSKKS
jgi:deoxyribonuclease-4